MSPSARTRVAAALATLPLLTAGCASLRMSEGECDLTAPPSPKTLTQPAYPQVSEEGGNVGIVVTNSGAPGRVTVRLDDQVALDVELPDSAGCSHSPVYSYYYDLPAGRVEVSAASGGGPSKKEPLLVGDRTRWVLVMTQESFPLHLDVSRSEPQFG